MSHIDVGIHITPITHFVVQRFEKTDPSSHTFCRVKIDGSAGIFVSSGDDAQRMIDALIEAKQYLEAAK